LEVDGGKERTREDSIARRDWVDAGVGFWCALRANVLVV